MEKLNMEEWEIYDRIDAEAANRDASFLIKADELI